MLVGEPDPHVHRFRLVIELGPAYNHSRLALLQWLLEWIVQLHATSPTEIKVRVEPDRDDE